MRCKFSKQHGQAPEYKKRERNLFTFQVLGHTYHNKQINVHELRERLHVFGCDIPLRPSFGMFN